MSNCAMADDQPNLLGNSGLKELAYLCFLAELHHRTSNLMLLPHKS